MSEAGVFHHLVRIPDPDDCVAHSFPFYRCTGCDQRVSYPDEKKAMEQEVCPGRPPMLEKPLGFKGTARYEPLSKTDMASGDVVMAALALCLFLGLLAVAFALFYWLVC